MDVGEDTGSAQGLMNLHNNEAGRKVSHIGFGWLRCSHKCLFLHHVGGVIFLLYYKGAIVILTRIFTTFSKECGGLLLDFILFL